MDFREFVDKYKDEALELLQKLVSINSVLDYSTVGPNQPFGKGIREALEFMESKAKEDGFDTLNDEGYALRVKLNGASKDSIAVLGHLDVVPVDDNWETNPFIPTIIDGKLYGRGSMDDKGPVVASYIALKILKNEGFRLSKNIELILGTDEETGWRGISHYKEKYQIPETGFSPDAEWPIINGEKGRIVLEFNGLPADDFTIHGGKVYNAVIGVAIATTKKDLTNEFSEYLKENGLEGNSKRTSDGYEYHLIGKTAHAMSPENGINAGMHLARFLNSYFVHPTLNFLTNCCFNDFNLAKLGLRCTHPVMGIITRNVGIMNIDKDKSFFTFDIRYPEGFRFQNFEAALKNILGVYSLTYELKENIEPHFIDPNSDLVQKLYISYIKYTNDLENKPKTIGGGTYAKVLKNGVAFGMEDPTKPSVAHISNEFIRIDKFLEAIAIYADAIFELGK